MKSKTMIGALIGIVIIILIVVLARGGQKTETTATDTSNTATVTVPANTNTTMPSTVQSADKLQVTTTKEGAGTGAVAGDTVSMNYTGTLTDGTVFDSNIDPKFQHVQPFSFTLGQHMVIEGWEQGVLGMKAGEKRHFVIPSSLGYGPNGQGPIPANATLIFDVELLSITHK